MSYLNLLITEIEKRKAYLEKLQSAAKQRLENSPTGKLRISKNRGIPRYYHIMQAKDKTGKYISKDNQEIIYKLAEKDYLNKLLKEVKQELQDINIYLNNHTKSNLEDIYSNMNDYRNNLINPLVLPDDLYVHQWVNESFNTNPYHLEQKIYPTRNGEMVRSKSEVLLADMYHELGIPYRYEAELLLKNQSVKYPDFTLLDIKNRKLIFHEHFGMLDDDEYRRHNLRKIDEYRRNGIYPGKNLIITHEADGSYLNIQEIKQMILELFQ